MLFSSENQRISFFKIRLFLTALLVLAAPLRAAAADDFTKVKRIAHAAGGIGGSVYTNSREALELTIAKGASCVEIDFMYTSDGTLVCNHGWEDFNKKAPSLKKFLKKKTPGGYTPMTARAALKILIRSGKLYLVPDTQEQDVAGVYRRIVSLCRKNGGTEYLKMIVPQIYRKDEFAKIRKAYKFRNWIYTLYKSGMRNNAAYRDIANFCRKNGIGVVTMAKSRVTRAHTDIIHKKGLLTAAHTVNKARELRELTKKGADIIYTDFLY